MINKISLENQTKICYNDRLVRLRSTLRARLKLFNMFSYMIDGNHKPLNMHNININLSNEDEITNFIVNNNEKMEFLTIKVEDWIRKNGSSWQKKRIPK